jgi:hypothetical protein
VRVLTCCVLSLLPAARDTRLFMLSSLLLPLSCLLTAARAGGNERSATMIACQLESYVLYSLPDYQPYYSPGRMCARFSVQVEDWFCPFPLEIGAFADGYWADIEICLPLTAWESSVAKTVDRPPRKTAHWLST